MYLQGPSQGLEPGSSVNGDIWAVRVRVDKMPRQNPEGNGLGRLDLSLSEPAPWAGNTDRAGAAGCTGCSSAAGDRRKAREA